MTYQDDVELSHLRSRIANLERDLVRLESHFADVAREALRRLIDACDGGDGCVAAPRMADLERARAALPPEPKETR